MELCCFFNYAPHYRFPIYKAIDNQFEPDWYFGDSVFENIKQFDHYELKGFKECFHTRKVLKSYYWHSHAGSLFRNKYTHYLLTGTPSCLINWLVLIYAKIRRKKVYLWTHGLTSNCNSKKARFINRLFYSYADGVFLYGRYAVPFMLDIGCKESKLHVIHNSLDTELQTKVYDSLIQSDVYVNHFGNHNPTVIYIGRIQIRKKLDLLIDAIALLVSEGFPVNLTFVGGVNDGIEDIEKRVRDCHLQDSTWFYGPCYDEAINGLLLFNAAVCVTPGSVGLTSIHSLSYGCPVISHDNFESQMPEFEAVEPSVTGDFYKEGDKTALAKTIRRWCTINEEQRQMCRVRARQTILREWSVSFQISTIREVIE